MSKLMTFNELRNLKDSLPDGSMHRIADELGVSVVMHRGGSPDQHKEDTVRCPQEVAF